jgi:hypothetical protein
MTTKNNKQHKLDEGNLGTGLKAFARSGERLNTDPRLIKMTLMLQGPEFIEQVASADRGDAPILSKIAKLLGIPSGGDLQQRIAKKLVQSGEYKNAKKAEFSMMAYEPDEIRQMYNTMIKSKDVVESKDTAYNKDAVDKEIKKDPRIKGKEAKAIHGLLKGRKKTDESEGKRCGKCGSNTVVNTKKGWYCSKCDEKSKTKVTEGVLDDQDDDGFMAKRQLYDLAKYAVELHRMIQDTDNLEPWIQAKITTAADYIDTVKHYMEYNQVRDADGTADVMGAPDMADIDSIGSALGGMDEESILEYGDEDVAYGDEDEGTELAGADILHYAALRGIISPERARNPDPALDQAADSFAFDIGPVFEIGSSDVSIWMRQFIEQYRGAVEFDGPRAHLYESKIQANAIYNRMMGGLKGKR